MGKIRVAIAGVGNCASALVQGVEYYKNATENESGNDFTVPKSSDPEIYNVKAAKE